MLLMECFPSISVASLVIEFYRCDVRLRCANEGKPGMEFFAP
jgi:hypothetical protein